MPIPCRVPLLLLLLVLSSACSGSAGRFSEANARAHLNMLAGTIGSRPAGTDANRRARDYLIDQLRLFGFDVRVQDADAARPEFGLTARVSNVIAVRNGARPDAIALVAHYDSVPSGPGAADDGIGVAVCLEAARLLAARPQPNYSLVVAFTDGEELGLMGAAALVDDPVVKARVGVVLNFESIGSAGPSYLFETHAASGLVSVWASSAVEPHGTSIGTEVYKRLPNDTDLSILRRLDIAALNFAPIEDSYAYHTARDTPDRVSPYTLRQTGDNLLTLVEAIDRQRLPTRADASTYFDVNGVRSIAYGRTTGRVLAVLAVMLGSIAWLRTIAAASRQAALGRLGMTALWLPIGFVLSVAAMIGATWALRASGGTLHPWYAAPGRLLMLLLAVAALSLWTIVRIATLLPAKFRASRDPAAIWAVALPVWMALAAWLEWRAPVAAYLCTIPLLTAGIVVCGVPLDRPLAVRTGSILVLGVTGTLWIPMSMALIRFTVATFARLPIVTPVFVYAGLVGVVGVMVVPAVGAIFAAPDRRLGRPSIVTVSLVAAVVLTAALAYFAPAYDYQHPARREVRYLHDGFSGQAWWEVGGLESGLDLAGLPGTPSDWHPAPASFDTRVPVRGVAAPFRFRASASPTPAPGTVQARLRPLDDAVELEVVARVDAPATVSFVMPPGVTPGSPNLPGRVSRGRWTAAYAAPPREGVAFRASIAAADVPKLAEAAVVVSVPQLPGGSGWQGLPSWLPQTAAVWTSAAVYVRPLGPVPDAGQAVALR